MPLHTYTRIEQLTCCYFIISHGVDFNDLIEKITGQTHHFSYHYFFFFHFFHLVGFCLNEYEYHS